MTPQRNDWITKINRHAAEYNHEICAIKWFLSKSFKSKNVR